MKRFMLFAYTRKYPSGAKDDEIGRYDTIDQCLRVFNRLTFLEHYDILDLRTGKWVDPEEILNIDLTGPKRIR